MGKIVLSKSEIPHSKIHLGEFKRQNIHKLGAFIDIGNFEKNKNIARRTCH